MKDDEFDRISAIAAQSRLWHTAQRIMEAYAAAWETSIVARWRRNGATRLASWPPDRRVRFGAMVIAWAGVFHLASRSVLPRYVGSGLPYPWIAVVIVGALVVAALAQDVAQAWQTSTLGRVVRAILKG